ncbi:MAG: NYN domain-containing protein [Gammaproteobacteria bacterium]|nr:NYN domain-containing protein [Gammaproteobacteria bacterium]
MQTVNIKTRVACFVDGFNLYHAIDDLNDKALLWLDLRRLMETFTDPSTHQIVNIFYYSAMASHRPSAAKRHVRYIKALRHSGVTVVLGSFKRKPRKCQDCEHTWFGYEEKQTDVNLAIGLVGGAYKNHYDEAFLVTGDSDITPAVQLVKELPKPRSIKLLSPPGRKHSKEIAQYADRLASIKQIHIERSLFPDTIIDSSSSRIVATKPTRWMTPSN